MKNCIIHVLQEFITFHFLSWGYGCNLPEERQKKKTKHFLNNFIVFLSNFYEWARKIMNFEYHMGL